jgi:hypothetical protein
LVLKRECTSASAVWVAPDEDLADHGLARAGGLAEHGVVDGHGPPAERHLALGLHELLEPLLKAPALDPVARQEHEARTVLAVARERDPRLLAGFLIECVGHLDEDARAVACVRLGARGTAVVEVLEDLDRLLEDPVRLASLHVDDEAHAARVVLVPRVVKPLLGRQAVGPAPRLAGLVRSLGHFWEEGFSVWEQFWSQVSCRGGRG